MIPIPVSGNGYLSVAVLKVMFLILYILPTEMGIYYYAVPLIITGIFSWFLGHGPDKEDERILLDEVSGQRIIVKNDNQLFWLPMQYGGGIFLLLATFLLFLKAEIIGGFAAILIISVLVFMEFRISSSEMVEPKLEEKRPKKTKFSSKAITTEKAPNLKALKASLVVETSKRKKLTEMTEEELKAYHKRYMPQ